MFSPPKRRGDVGGAEILCIVMCYTDVGCRREHTRRSGRIKACKVEAGEKSIRETALMPEMRRGKKRKKEKKDLVQKHIQNVIICLCVSITGTGL